MARAKANWLALPVISALLSFSAPASAGVEKIGVFGNTYSIAEKDAVNAIKDRIRELYRNGTIDKLKKEWLEKAKWRLRHGPDPVPGIVVASQNRIRTFDPTFTLDHDVFDHEGRLIAAKGTRVNPLDYQPLTKQYIFIDGRDKAQVDWALKKLKEIGGIAKGKIILVGGSPLRLAEQYGVPFYFDQFGRITHRLGITAVPCVLRQSSKNPSLAEIEEVALR
ncbi:type-F conjugative transfer system protein TraW [Candidatus Parcubacteria bacterium]|nr:MAG: type-F conjugative transfer system protein TraW [Candidatus Parcubacteria bacterium]